MKFGFYAKTTGLSLLAGLLFSTGAMADVSRTCSSDNQSSYERNKRSGIFAVFSSTARQKCRTSAKPQKVKRKRLVRIPVMLGVYR